MAVMDVTLRDGLMDRPRLPTPDKVAYLAAMERAGISAFEVMRFPLDSRYPQFDDGIALLEALNAARGPATRLAVFSMGVDGLPGAAESLALFDELHVPCFVSEAYETYAFGSRCWPELRARYARMAERCATAGVDLTVGVGTAFGCPITRRVTVDATVQRCQEIADIGVTTIMIGDTAGMACPTLVAEVAAAIRVGCPGVRLRAHMHDTFGRALMNSEAAYRAGVKVIDASAMGLGGERHNYFMAPDQVNNGNAALEEVCTLLSDQFGMQTYDLAEINRTCRWLFERLDPSTIFGRAAFAELVELVPGGEVQTSDVAH